MIVIQCKYIQPTSKRKGFDWSMLVSVGPNDYEQVFISYDDRRCIVAIGTAEY